MRMITSPFLTDWPSLNGNAINSPETSGAIPTSSSGCTLPVAVTRCVIVRIIAFSVVTVVGTTACLFLIPAAMRSTTTMTMARMIHHFRRDFLRTGTAAGTSEAPERGAVMKLMVGWSG